MIAKALQSARTGGFGIMTWAPDAGGGYAKCQVSDLAFSVVAPTGFEPALPP
jgi:hypothetical protein